MCSTPGLNRIIWPFKDSVEASLEQNKVRSCPSDEAFADRPAGVVRDEGNDCRFVGTLRQAGLGDEWWGRG